MRIRFWWRGQQVDITLRLMSLEVEFGNKVAGGSIEGDTATLLLFASWLIWIISLVLVWITNA